MGIEIREDIDFLDRAEAAVGWSALTEDDKYYKNPWLKYNFYQDVFENLDKFTQRCDEPETIQKINDIPKCSQTSEKDCSRIRPGMDVYEQKTEEAIAELRSLSSKLDKAAKDHAAIQIAAGTASAVAAGVGICIAVIGVIGAPFTFGGSLSLTAVGIAATAVGVAAGIVTLVNNMVKDGVTNEYVAKLEKQHKRASSCTADMVKLFTAL